MADLLVEKTNHLGILKLNRPDRMNAISVAMLNDLGEALKEFDSDPKIRAIILTGEGRGFCSGLDLKDTAAGRGIGAGLATLIKMPFAVCCVSVPLGLWEAVERIGVYWLTLNQSPTR